MECRGSLPHPAARLPDPGAGRVLDATLGVFGMGSASTAGGFGQGAILEAATRPAEPRLDPGRLIRRMPWDPSTRTAQAARRNRAVGRPHAARWGMEWRGKERAVQRPVSAVASRCVSAISSGQLSCRHGGFAQGGILRRCRLSVLILFALFVPLAQGGIPYGCHPRRALDRDPRGSRGSRPPSPMCGLTKLWCSIISLNRRDSGSHLCGQGYPPAPR